MFFTPTLLAVLLPAAAGPVEFTYQGIIECGGERIDVGSYAAPVMVDYNGSGLQDLLIGQFDEGRIRLYENTGTPGSPVFEDFIYLMDGEEYLTVPYG